MDRISQLPECIIHHILSSLNTPAELVRMSVLSKTWSDLTASFPVLDFNIRNFRSPESFFKYVEYNMSRFCHQNVTTDTLKLITTLKEPAELDTVNRCLDLVLKNGVRELVVDITNSSYVQKYRLPNTPLSVSVLEFLTISGCELPSSLMVDVVKFKSLIHLKLNNVHIDDEVIKHLTTSCPLLQLFQISRCHGFSSFCVYGHQNLQQVIIIINTHVERIDIEAPNLSRLVIIDMYGRRAPQMNLASCKKLTTVVYYGNTLPNSNGFTDFLSNFPFIENLVFVTSYKCSNLKLSSHSLRKLMIISEYDLEQIEFSTPNLGVFIHSCNYCSIRLPLTDIVFSMLRHSIHWKSCMQCYPDVCIDALWFQKLRLFLDKKNGFKVLNLYIHAVYTQKFTELDKLKAIELPPYELEHVELQLDTREESSTHIAFVDAVLWCCRPQSLTLRSSFPLTGNENVVKFTYEKLLQQEGEGHTKIQIVSPSSSKAQKHFTRFMSLPWTLPHEGKAISFIKEKDSQ